MILNDKRQIHLQREELQLCMNLRNKNPPYPLLAHRPIYQSTFSCHFQDSANFAATVSQLRKRSFVSHIARSVPRSIRVASQCVHLTLASTDLPCARARERISLEIVITTIHVLVRSLLPSRSVLIDTALNLQQFRTASYHILLSRVHIPRMIL